MKTKKEFEAMGFVFTTLGGGAVSATKLLKNKKGELETVSATAKTLPTLRKKLSTLV